MTQKTVTRSADMPTVTDTSPDPSGVDGTAHGDVLTRVSDGMVALLK